MMTSPYRTRPLKGSDLNEMQRSNLRALLRQLRRGFSWIEIARLLNFRRAYIRDFFDGIEPGSMALARGIAAASGLDLDTALAGHFTHYEQGRSAATGEVMRFVINEAGNRIVDATPEETHALRPVIYAALRRHGCPEREIDDIAQHVEVFTWQAIAEGRVQGHDLQEPRDALIAWMLTVAYNAFRTYRQKHSNWREVMTNEPAEWASRSPIGRIEARDMLRRLVRYPHVAKLLVDAANEVSRDVRRNDAGVPDGTYYSRLTAARKWARKVAETGRWRKPPMPEPPNAEAPQKATVN